MKIAQSNFFAPVALVAILVIVGLTLAFVQKSPDHALSAEVTQIDGPMVIASSTVSTTTSTAVIATSTGRQYARITNDSANTVYLAVGQSAIKGKGIPLAAGAAFEINELNLFSGAVNAIASTSATGPTSNLSVITRDY